MNNFLDTPLEEAKELDNSPVLMKKFNFEAIEVKEVDVEGTKYGRILGYAATYDLDRVNDTIMPGAFSKAIKSYQSTQRPIRMYYDHDYKELIGAFQPGTMHEDTKGLYVEGDINLEVQRGREIYALAKQGVLSEMSIGYRVREFDLEKGVRQLKEIDLCEISIVGEPANPQAKITAIKSVDELKDFIKKKSDLEKVLREAGFSRSSAKYIASMVDLKKIQEDDTMDESKSTLCDEVVTASDAPSLEEKLGDVVLPIKSIEDDESGDESDDSMDDIIDDGYGDELDSGDIENDGSDDVSAEDPNGNSLVEEVSDEGSPEPLASGEDHPDADSEDGADNATDPDMLELLRALRDLIDNLQ